MGADNQTLSAAAILDAITVRYTAAPILESLSLTLLRGEVTALVGISGCGKTTLLNAIAGFVQPQGGEVRFPNGKPRIGFVFQEDALFPWKTLGQNIAQGTEIRGRDESDRMSFVCAIATKLGLEDALALHPSELSGGMAQRGQLARALACEPNLMLLDEPLSKLDVQTRYEIQLLLQSIISAHETLSTVIVTHDIDEALLLADRVLVMSGMPATISEDFVVPFGRPRTSETQTLQEYIAMRRRVFDLIQSDYRHSIAARNSRKSNRSGAGDE